MTTNDDQAVMILNDLLLVCRDAEKGFQTAADNAQLPALVELFEGFSLQRAKFAQELEERIKTLRATPAKVPSQGAALHRAWMGLKAAIDANEAHALLAECERGEDLAVKAYGTALKDPNLDGQSRTLIQRHYELVQAAHDRVRQLRDSETFAHL